MRIQTWESPPQIHSVAAAATLALRSPRVRPRISGFAGSMQGDAYNAFLADSARVTFAIYPASTTLLTDLSATARIEPFPIHASGPPQASFPAATQNVTAALWLDGVLHFDLTDMGTSGVLLSVTNNGATTAALYVICRIVGDERAIDVNPQGMRDGGET